jgi:hypothetical protein
MADLGMAFDANSVPEQQSFDTIPPGKYPVQIVQSEMRANKANTGKYLWLEMQVTEGQHTGRLLWDRLNLINPNQTAVDIAYQTLGAICKAVGIGVCQDSEQLHLKPFLANVKVKPAQGSYEASNEIKGYEPISGRKEVAAPAKPATPAAATANAPWRKAKAAPAADLNDEVPF